MCTGINLLLCFLFVCVCVCIELVTHFFMPHVHCTFAINEIFSCFIGFVAVVAYNNGFLLSPWYNHNGQLGVKHQVTYLFMLVVVCLFCDQSFTVCVMIIFTVSRISSRNTIREGLLSGIMGHWRLIQSPKQSFHILPPSPWSVQCNLRLWFIIIMNDLFIFTLLSWKIAALSFSVDIIIMYNIICRDVCGVQYLYYGEEKSSIKQEMWLVHCLHRMKLDSSSSSYFKTRKMPSCFTVLIRWSWELNYLSGLEEEEIFHHLHSRTQLNLSDVRLPVPACPCLCTHA